MDYKKKYKEALERAREYWETDNDNTLDIKAKGTMEYLFPELAESEEEKIISTIRKALEAKVEDLGNGVTKTACLAWLERQSEQKSKKVSLWKHWKDGIAGGSEGEQIFLIKNGNTYSISSCLGFECDYIELSELDKLLEKQGKTSLTLSNFLSIGKNEDKVEPKFKVGDWMVYEENTYQIHNISLKKYYECIRTDGTVHTFDFEYIDSKSHIWTIKDAKDGDVLITENKNIFIFKSINDYTIYDYCGLYFERFTNSSGTVNGKAARQLPTNYVPATKEQRDLLFQKMKEAGYEWDAEKKELKKIDKENLTEFEIAVKNVMEEAIEDGDTHNLKADAENLLRIIQPTWNKEDERILNSLISSLVRIGANTRTDSTSINYTFPREINWLKSLKQRMGG